MPASLSSPSSPARAPFAASPGSTGLLLSEVTFFILFFVVVCAVYNSSFQSRLHCAASTDSLTQLLNRAGMEKQLLHYLNYKGSIDRGGVLFLVDIDNFKSINDTLGHDAGDEALIQAARRLRSCFRDYDMIGHIGGDEFMVFCPDMTDVKVIRRHAEQICKVNEEPVLLCERSVPLSFSIGISIYPEDGADFRTLSQKADIAITGSKNPGRRAISSLMSAHKRMTFPKK